MNIQKVFSDVEGEEKIYSVLMNEEEVEFLFSVAGELKRMERAAKKVSKNAWVKSQGGRNSVKTIDDKIISRSKFIGDGASVSRNPGGRTGQLLNKKGKKFFKTREDITRYRYDHPVNDYNWNKDLLKNILKR